MFETQIKRSESSLDEQQEALKRGTLPSHVAIIMDGNGRWAKALGKSRIFGHRAGTKSVREVTEACAQLGISYLTLYTFSTENWNRPPAEVHALMELLVATVRREVADLNKNNIRISAIGDLGQLPKTAAREMAEAMESTAGNDRLTLTLALSYSGRTEITAAVREIARRVQDGSLHEKEINTDLISSFLYTRDMPEPELMIRTGGEKRISNFLMWQLAYTELYFTDVFWPDFGREQLYEALRDFQSRQRRFGRVAP